SVSKKKAPAKADRNKGIEILSDVTLSKEAQLKEATKRSKNDYHISQASGSGDGTYFESWVPDEQQHRTSGTDEGTSTKLGVPDVPTIDSDDDDENPSFTLKDYDKEEHDEEYESNDDYENMFEEEEVDIYKDVDVTLLVHHMKKKRKVMKR
nr:hypothetical protein [Tanacetum cinerariifolium]